MKFGFVSEIEDWMLPKSLRIHSLSNAYLFIVEPAYEIEGQGDEILESISNLGQQTKKNTEDIVHSKLIEQRQDLERLLD